MTADIQHPGSHRPYRPSNATEGDLFMADWCCRCAHHNHDDAEFACMVQLRALAHNIGDPDYPDEWQLTNAGTPQCTAFAAEAPAAPRCDQTIDMFASMEGKGT